MKLIPATPPVGRETKEFFIPCYCSDARCTSDCLCGCHSGQHLAADPEALYRYCKRINLPLEVVENLPKNYKYRLSSL